MRKEITEILIQCNGANAGMPESPTWHIGVADVAEDMDEVVALGGVARRERLLSMQAASNEKVALPAAFEKITQTIMLRAEAAEAALVVTQAELNQVSAALVVAVEALKRGQVQLSADAPVDSGNQAG